MAKTNVRVDRKRGKLPEAKTYKILEQGEYINRPYIHVKLSPAIVKGPSKTFTHNEVYVTSVIMPDDEGNAKYYIVMAGVVGPHNSDCSENTPDLGNIIDYSSEGFKTLPKQHLLETFLIGKGYTKFHVDFLMQRIKAIMEVSETQEALKKSLKEFVDTL